MFKRTLKKFIGGKWEPIKWTEVRVGDKVRVYERGMLSETDTEVQAPHSLIEIDGNSYIELTTSNGKINSKGLLSKHCEMRNPNKRKNRARFKKITPGG